MTRRALLPVALAGLLAAAACGPAPRFRQDFESEADLDALGWKCRTLLALSTRHATSGARSLEMVCFPAPGEGDGVLPGVSLQGLAADWSGRRSVAFDLFNAGSDDAVLLLQVADREAPAPSDRSVARIAIRPGENRVVVPLSRLVAAATGRSPDLRRVREVTLALSGPPGRRTLYLDRFRVE